MEIESNFLKYLITFGMNMLPILEMRIGIPFALGVLKLNLLEALIWSILGNILAVAILLKYLDPVTQWLMRHSKKINQLLTHLFEKTRHQHSLRFKEIGALFLIILVAIPLPGGGGWTGALVAFLFGVRFWSAMGLISVGIMLSAGLMTLGVTSVSAMANLLFN